MSLNIKHRKCVIHVYFFCVYRSEILSTPGADPGIPVGGGGGRGKGVEFNFSKGKVILGVKFNYIISPHIIDTPSMRHSVICQSLSCDFNPSICISLI